MLMIHDLKQDALQMFCEELNDTRGKTWCVYGATLYLNNLNNIIYKKSLHSTFIHS